MKSTTRFVVTKHRRVILFSLIIISLMMSCNIYSIQEEGDGSPVEADISNGLVMNGTATITYYNTNTCTNAGTAGLTVNTDGTFILVANGPSVGDLCEQSGDRTNATFYGTVNTLAFEMYITSCTLARQPVGEAEGWITNVDAKGAAICYSVKPDGTRGTKYYYVTFDVKK